MNKVDSLVTRLVGALAAMVPATALAQAPAPAPAAPAPAPAAPPAVAPAAPPPAAAAPAPAPAPVAPPPVAVAPPPAALPPPPPADAPPPPPPPPPAEEKMPSIDVGAWLRAGIRFQGATDPKKINDQAMDAVYGELHLSGKITPKVSYTLNFNANGLAAKAGIMDAIIGLDPIDEFHFWAGQLLVPVDRSNFSGPFFMSPWNYPGVFSVGGAGGFVGPNEGPSGRNTGGVVWGDIGKGTFKYYAGMMNLSNRSERPLYSGRLAFAAIGKEPGYYGSSTYYGDQDILAFGVGAQYQKKGSVGATDPTTMVAPTDDFSDINADVLAEFKLGDSGVLTGEAAYYHLTGDYNLADNNFFVLASYLSPDVGIGKIQPMVRYQWAKKKGADDPMSVIDAFVTLVIKGYTWRATAGFQHTDLGNDVVGNAIQIGLQTIQF
ncbi:MAG TPA: hypothetical protein VFQ35_20815 [Polyangiaceae bacterium]|nr:hypothetical protein [Polyangiaceae bacterium]